VSWRAALAALVAVRVAIPLAALAAEGSRVPGLPRYDYEPLAGDGHAYYSTARALVAGWRALGAARLLVIGLLVVVAAVVAVRVWRRAPRVRHRVVVLFGLVVFLACAAAVHETGDVPAGAVGWPLLLSIPLLPLRVVDAAGPDAVFAIAVVLALAANAAAVVATAYAGRDASGRREVGLLAAGLLALWPLLTWPLAGGSAWENGTWAIEAGLTLYTEPVSTALVAVGAALVLRRSQGPLPLALAGLALGYATAVRPTNGIVAVLALALVARRAGLPRTLPYLGGALAVAPVVLAFLPKRRGYELAPVSDERGALFSVDHVVDSFADSLLWEPRALAVIVPFAVAGAFLLRSRPAALFLAGWALANPVVYAFFRATADHPRYLFASLPAVLVLWAAGAVGLADLLRRPSIMRAA